MSATANSAPFLSCTRLLANYPHKSLLSSSFPPRSSALCSHSCLSKREFIDYSNSFSLKSNNNNYNYSFGGNRASINCANNCGHSICQSENVSDIDLMLKNGNNRFSNNSDTNSVAAIAISDLQPLHWLQKESIIDIDPLDIEDELSKDDSDTPGHGDLIDPHLCHAPVEIESQENSNVHDFVRFQAMRSGIQGQGGGTQGLGGCRGAGIGSGATMSPHITGQQGSAVPPHSINCSATASGFSKPNLSYTQLIFMAIETCRDRAMTVNDIYQWCELNYPYYKHIGPSWKNSLRHNLSINKSFRRMPRDGQTSVGSYELNINEDGPDDGLYLRDNKQGGPGRGAYWVVDEKERKNLLDSIYRAHQTMPLADRNGQRIDPPYPLFINPPKNGPMLRIDGRFTDASTYLQSKRSDDDVTNENNQINVTSHTTVDSFNQDLLIMKPDSCDAEYASMMSNLATTSSPDLGDSSIKLSASYNSNCSRLVNEEPDSTDPSRPKLKNRRKSKHEKVRNYSEMDLAGKECEGNRRNPKSDLTKPNQGMTSVNVIVAPHFDHIYARYQQFLPPAIASDMEKTVMNQHNEIDSNPDAEFLNRHFRDEEDDEEDSGNENGDNEDSQLIIDANSAPIKLEKIEADVDPIHNSVNNRRQSNLNHHFHPSRPSAKLPGSRRLHKLWSSGAQVKFNAASVAFTRQRKVRQRQQVRQMSGRRVRRSLRPDLNNCGKPGEKEHRSESDNNNNINSCNNKITHQPTNPINGINNSQINGGDTGDNHRIEVKQEMLEADEMNPLKDEPSDGYATDSTMPMMSRRAVRRRVGRPGTAASKSTAMRLVPVKRKASTVSKSSPPEKRYRSKRKRTRPLRIDESKEMAAIQFLASLEKRQQNIDNLYNLNRFLKSTLSGGESSCNSSVVLVHE